MFLKLNFACFFLVLGSTTRFIAARIEEITCSCNDAYQKYYLSLKAQNNPRHEGMEPCNSDGQCTISLLRCQQSATCSQWLVKEQTRDPNGTGRYQPTCRQGTRFQGCVWYKAPVVLPPAFIPSQKCEMVYDADIKQPVRMDECGMPDPKQWMGSYVCWKHPRHPDDGTCNMKPVEEACASGIYQHGKFQWSIPEQLYVYKPPEATCN